MKNPPKIFSDAKNIDRYSHIGEMFWGRLCKVCKAPNITMPEMAFVRLIKGE